MQSTRRIMRGAAAAAAIVLGAATATPAAQYQAWGDTGWVYGSKRECCDAAIAIAEDYSATACLNTGGVPRPPLGGGRRGACTAEWTQDTDGSLLYRCHGEAALWCR